MWCLKLESDLNSFTSLRIVSSRLINPFWHRQRVSKPGDVKFTMTCVWRTGWSENPAVPETRSNPKITALGTPYRDSATRSWRRSRLVLQCGVLGLAKNTERGVYSRLQNRLDTVPVRWHEHAQFLLPQTWTDFPMSGLLGRRDGSSFGSRSWAA